MRKQIIKSTSSAAEITPGGLDVSAIAIVLVTSELSDHPVENVFDGGHGPGSSRWIAGTDGEQTFNLAFDAPQDIRSVALEIEETTESRTQELQLAVSLDGGKSYRELLRQEFHFSPEGSTFEREEWTINLNGVTHLRFQIKPDKGGRPARASISSLVLR
jgi:hypothetical protein